MKKKINKIAGIVVLVFLVLGVVLIFYNRHQFLENYKFTTGRVTEITPPGWKSSGDYSILYDYWIDNKIYHNNENYNYCRGLSMSKVKSLLVGKQFPVAYSANDAGTCSMLITQKNADRFHYQLPDSVRFYDSTLTCK
jgi:hypothetical protein